jgi:hypothetical protein
MSYEDRIQAALSLVQQHNEAVGGEGKPGFINPDAFISCVKASGGTSEKRLADLSHEDLLACMPSHIVNGVEVKPRVLAKDIAKVFRSNQQKVAEDAGKRPVSTKKAEKMTPRELVEAFDPEDYSNPVGERLAVISKGEKFIVYSEGRLVDVDTTFKLLTEIKAGYPGRDDVDVNGAVKKVYRIGELPENYADENPLYRDRPLRPDGTCDQTGRSWEGVDLAVRQLVRVAMDTGELRVTHETAHDILDMVMEPNPLANLRKRYRKASVRFDELAKTGDLPKLMISLGEGGSESINPFAGGKQVVWAADPAVPNAYVTQARNFHRGWTYTSNVAPKWKK